MAVAASVALRRLASGPDSQNAARTGRIGGSMPSGTLGPLVLSFHIVVIIAPASQKLIEDKEMTINAAHSTSGVRTSKLGYEDHLRTKIVSGFDVARLLALM
eukprot:4174680-Pleurochrysis_carterae.AAC.2